ncbi:helix-turn-helix domain-containing protein [Isoptericola variabilis]|nr:helix-turn-helix domain-containing protein [Isoptericola variabilis]
MSAAPASGPQRPQYRGRHLPMVAVVVAAFIATALAYSGMVLFGLEVAGMTPMEAYSLAGFLEVSLVAVALLARNAALEGRPYGVLLTLTWILSGTSGVFAALHEVAVPSETTPYMVVFRFVPPLVAALMWHLALVGERHLVTGHTLDERRREHRVHQYVATLETWRDARRDNTGTRRGTRKVRVAHARQRAARDRALKLLTVEDFERRMQVWVDRLEAAERHGNRLDTIGASSAKRGVVRAGEAEVVVEPVPAPAPVLAAAPADAPADAPVDLAAALSEGADEAPFQPVQAFEELPDFAVRVKEAFAERQPATWTEPPAPSSTEPSPATGLTPRVEPLPETGHTRRVEEIDLRRVREAAEAAASRGSGPDGEHDGRAEHAGTAPAADERAGDQAGDQADGDADGRTDEPAGEQLSGRDRLILELARDGRTQAEIASLVDVSRTTVSRVLRRHGPRTELVDTESGPEIVPA